MGDNKQRLFEVMGRLDPSFKSKIIREFDEPTSFNLVIDNSFIKDLINSYKLHTTTENTNKFTTDIIDFIVMDYVDDEIILDIKNPKFSKIINSVEFYSFAKIWLSNKIDKLKNEIVYKINSDNTINIYRAITINQEWLNHIDKNNNIRVGMYWTWDESKINPVRKRDDYMFHGNIMAIIESKIDMNKINWLDTFILNIHPEYGGDESEIRLYKNTQLKILSIKVNNNIIDVDLKNKNFYA